jgi:AraC family transcriptional regulator
MRRRKFIEELNAKPGELSLDRPSYMPPSFERIAAATPRVVFGSSVPQADGNADPVTVMTEVLDRPPVLMDVALPSGTRLTRPWRHGELHHKLPVMNSHVVITYYGGSAPEAVWHNNKGRLVSRVRPGTVSIIPSGYDGRWDISGELEISQVYLTDERLQSAAAPLTDGKRAELVGRALFDDPVAGRVMAILSQEETSAGPHSRLFLDQALDLLCTQLVRAHSNCGVLPAPAPRRGLADWQIRRVMNYAHEHLDQEISLEDLAALVSLSRFHFCTAFRLAIGSTPHNWLVRLRMERAQQLLAGTDLTIIQVALAVGYETPSAFTASFRKAFGITPSAFRQRL